MPTNEQRRQAAKRKLERQLARRAERRRRRRQAAVVSTVVTIVVIVVAVFLLTTVNFGRDDATAAAPPTVGQPLADTGPAAAPTRPKPLPETVPCGYPPSVHPPAKLVQPPPPEPASARGTVKVVLGTSAGEIPLTLDRALAPCTVQSFVSLTRQGYFDNTPCHRLTTSDGLRVLQCGDPTGTGTGGPGYTIPDEAFPELTYRRGYLAMANTGAPNSGGSQFFMIYRDSRLPPNYTVFGTIDPQGLQVIDRVAAAGSDGSLEPSPGGGKPNVPVQITSTLVIE